MDKQRLIEQCKQGDRAAFGKLYNLYAPRMMRVIRRFVVDRASAEDILHDGFVLVFTHITEVKDTTKIEQWMGAIMRNLALQYLREIDITTDLEEEGDFEDCPDPEALLTYEELQTIIERLPEGYKTIFRLSVLEGKSHKEIAEMLGIAPHTASSQLYRARVLLRKLIAEHLATIAILLLLLVPVGALLYLHFGTEGDKGLVGTDFMSVRETVRDTMDINKIVPQDTVAVGTDFMSVRETVRGTTDLDKLSPYIVPQDTVAKTEENLLAQTDTTQTVTPPTAKLKDLSMPQLAYTPTAKKKTRWVIGARFSTSGVSDNPLKSGDVVILADPTDNPDFEDPSQTTPPVVNPGQIMPPIANPEITSQPDKTTHHDTPLTFGLRIGRPLTKHWGIETGLDFTYLRSRFGYEGSGINLQQQTKAYYLGIPLKLNCQFFNSPKWSIYGTAGIGIEIPVKSSLQSEDRSTRASAYGAESFHAPWQGNLSGGVGLQYNLTPRIGIYAEPSVQHHFGGTSTLPTLWQDCPTTFTIPIGLRFHW